MIAFLDAEVAEGQWWDRETKAWVFDHAERQSAKGNGFSFQVIDVEALAVGALQKRMLPGQGDSPVVARPTQAGTYRWLTLGDSTSVRTSRTRARSTGRIR